MSRITLGHYPEEVLMQNSERQRAGREVSILIATFLGVRVLSEGNARRRAIGAVGMVAGVTLLALA